MKLRSVFICIAMVAGALGFTVPSAATADALPAGVAPVLESTGFYGNDGFEISVANFDNGSRYSWSVDQGAVAASIQPTTGGRTKLLLTVTQIPPGSSATLTVAANQDGFAPATTTVTGFAKQAGFTPILGSSIRGDSAYSSPIYNYDPAYSWTFRALGVSRSIRINVLDCHPSNTETVPCVNVSDLNNGETVTIEVTVSRAGYSTSTFNITGTSLANGEDVQLGNYVQTVDGFTVQNLKPDSAFAWSISVNHGSIAFGSNNTLIVTGLSPGQEAQVRVISRNPNTYLISREFFGKALPSGATTTPAPTPPTASPEPTPAPTQAPAPSSPTPTVDPSPTPTPVPTPIASPSPAPTEVPSLPGTKVEPTVKLGIAELKALTVSQLKALKPKTISALPPKVLASLQVNKLKALTRAQIRAILHIQWLKLSAQQRKALRW